MPFDDAELDRLGQERENLKEERDRLNDEIDSTFRDAKDLEDDIRELEREADRTRGLMSDAFASADRARRSKDYRFAQSESESGRGYQESLRDIQDDIRRKRAEKRDAWDRHNAAKSRRSEVKRELSRVRDAFQERLAELREEQRRQEWEVKSYPGPGEGRYSTIFSPHGNPDLDPRHGHVVVDEYGNVDYAREHEDQGGEEGSEEDE